MKQHPHVLFYGSSSTFGNIISRNFIHNGFTASFTKSNSIPSESEIAKQIPDIFILETRSSSPEYFDYYKNLKTIFPNMKIVAFMYFYSEDFFIALEHHGVDCCVSMPMNVNDVFLNILSTFGLCTAYKFDQYVTRFMIRLGIPANALGFGYLCTSVCQCLCEPDLVENEDGRLFFKIAEAYGADTKSVEETLNHFSDDLFRRGIYENFLGNSSFPVRRLSAPELVSTVSSAFAYKYKIYEEELQNTDYKEIPQK